MSRVVNLGNHEIVLTQFCSQATSGTSRGSFRAEY